MMHLSVVVLGNLPIAEQLGKKGTENDLILYNHASSEGVFTYITIKSEKIQPLLQAVNMGSVCVIAMNELTKQVGEQLVLASTKSWTKGFFLLEGLVPEQIHPLVKGTALEQFEVVSGIQALREKLINIQYSQHTEDVWIPIDIAFHVKSVGTIVLGIVQQGSVKKYDTLRLEPLGKEVTIKSIQSQDREIPEAGVGTRVGLSLKGVEAEEIRRGFVVCKQGTVTKEMSVAVKQSPFYKTPIEPAEKVFFNAGLQVVSATYNKESNTMHLDAPVVVRSHEQCIVASQRTVVPRIIGSAEFKKP